MGLQSFGGKFRLNASIDSEGSDQLTDLTVAEVLSVMFGNVIGNTDCSLLQAVTSSQPQIQVCQVSTDNEV